MDTTMSIMPWFVEAVVATLAGSSLVGLWHIIRLLVKVQRALDHLGPSMETLYTLQPYVLKTLRHQTAALREIGANGSTEKADECIDEAEKIINQRHAKLESELGSVGRETS